GLRSPVILIIEPGRSDCAVCGLVRIRIPRTIIVPEAAFTFSTAPYVINLDAAFCTAFASNEKSENNNAAKIIRVFAATFLFNIVLLLEVLPSVSLEASADRKNTFHPSFTKS